jgi:uncharacterized membrane protein
MNYYNIFLIIIIIDISIFFIEGIIFYTYVKSKVLNVSLLFASFFHNLGETALNNNNIKLSNSILNEQKEIIANQKTSIYTFGFILIFVYVLIIAYYYFVKYYLKKNIDLKYSFIVIGIVSSIIIIIEIATIFSVLLDMADLRDELDQKSKNISLSKLCTIYNCNA